MFGCSGFVSDDGKPRPTLILLTQTRLSVLVDALIRGFEDGQDILTLSLGGTDGWTEGTTSVLTSRIAQTGKIVTIAAGNDVRCFLLCLNPSFSGNLAGIIWFMV